KLGFQPLSGPRGVADDLKKFPGASPAIEKQLNDLGIFHVWQIAELSPIAAHKIGEEVGLPGRVEGFAFCGTPGSFRGVLREGAAPEAAHFPKRDATRRFYAVFFATNPGCLRLHLRRIVEVREVC
ncbi:MAG: hypothetical protein ACLQVM_13215, partial [Terriglobia bacterium]